MENNVYYSLTHPQQRIWYSEMLQTGTSFANICGSVRIKKEVVNPKLLKKAINLVIKQNDALRIRIRPGENGVQQYVAAYQETELEIIQGLDWEECLTKKSQMPFSLIDTNLFYFALVKFSEENYGFYFKLHHIISDGFSFSILIKQIVEYYDEMERGQTVAEKLKPSFFAYFQREEEYLASAQCIKDREYWLERLNLLPEPLNLQFSSVKQGINSTRRIFKMPEQLQGKIEQFCSQHETTLFRFMMATLYTYLSRAYNSNDLIIGTAYYNRVNREELNTIGMYVSTIPVRICMGEKMNFGQLLKLVHQQLISDMAHQQYPYDMLVQDLRNRGQNPDGLLNINLVQIPNGKNSKYVSQAYYQGADPAMLNMVINPNQLPKGAALEVALDYRTNLFKPVDVERLFNCLLTLIEDILANPEKELSQLEIMPEAEKQRVLIDFNQTSLSVPQETIVDLFREQAAKTPENIAVVDYYCSLTYAELDQLTDSLAFNLRNLGVIPNSIVGIMVPRTVDFVVGALAIMKAGGAYLPISADYPEGRIEHIINDSQIKVLLGVKQFEEKAIGFKGTFLPLDSLDLSACPAQKLGKVNQPLDLAYIIYTSGSTGKPKGVMISHANLLNLCCWHNSYYQTTAADSSALYFNTSFDASVKQIFPFLIQGAAVLIIPEKILLDIEELNNYLTEKKVTFLGLPTQFAETFMERCDNRFLKYMIVGGEKLRSYKAGSYQLVNEYGPTEFTVCSTYFPVKQELDNIPIGKPVANSWAYVLDKQGALQPIGIPGELCLAGAQIARGYLNRAELTAEKFVPNPYATCPENAVMYKTGDLVRWLPDGNLEYLGRIDMQVKIRGYRIELGEIELAMLNFPGITNSVVLDFPDTNGSKYLCAYFTAAGTIDVDRLKQFLAKDLPSYMIPGAFMQIPAIPVNQNGKVDRRALPKPDISANQTEYVAPANELQANICSVWEETLGLDRVGIKDDFFVLGGTSIKAMALQSKLQKYLGTQIAIGDIFSYPTPELLASLVKDANKYVPIPLAPLAESYPLTPPQRQMYILRQTLSDGTVYNIPAAFTIKGTVDRERLNAAFNNLIKRHIALRSYFVNVEGEPRQKVAEQVNFQLIYQEATQDEVGAIIALYNYSFNLAEPLLFRAGLITIAKDQHILFLIGHHIILDGLSIDILINDLLAIYEGEHLEPVRIDYPDFAVWQDKRLTETVLANQEKYWLNLFADEIPALELATDYPRPPVMSHAGAVISQVIDKKLTKALSKLAQENKTTLFTVLLAGYMALLARYTGKEDLVIGIPFAGRVHPDVETTVGMFVNTLPLRSRPEYEKTFKTLLAEVKEQVTKAQENQDYPLEILVQKLGIRPDPSRNPLFDVLFNFLTKIDHQGDLDLEEYQSKIDIAHFDLSLDIEEGSESLRAIITYCTMLYCPETIEKMLSHYLTLLSLVAGESDLLLGDLRLLSEKEKQTLLEDFNQTALSIPQRTMVDLFREQAAKTPENIAVVDYYCSLTYAELDRLTDSLAFNLRNLGVIPNSIVGIMVPRTVDFVVGALAIMKAGGAYLPISADYPEGRIEHIINDSQIKVLLGVKQFEEKAIGFKGTFLPLDSLDLSACPAQKLEKVNQPLDLAYIIYTSGSTGKPKGVMISHANLLNLCCWHNSYYQTTAADISALYFNTSFDASVKQIFPFLIQGAAVLIIPEKILLDIEELNNYLTEKKVTFLGLPTQFAETFMERCDNRFLKYMIVGGEKLRSYKAGSYQLVNEYGPTEFTVCSTYFPVKQELDNIPIGKPVANSWAYVLDKQGALQPIGIPGELCLAGAQIARGYLNRAELTAEKFVPNPYTTCPENAVMYKTGDLVRWLPDGNLEYLGRIDMQVKIRGYRIELGEIELAMLNFPGITNSVVLDLPDANGSKYLCAYFTAAGTIDVDRLKQFLAKDLPSYMIPGAFMQILAIPVNQNGKVDKRALPKPDISANQTEYVAPRNEKEEKIAVIWQEILGIEKVGIHDDFFHLGGHSLKVSVLINKIRKAFNVEVAYQEVFNNSVLKDFAALVSSAEKILLPPIEKSEELPFYPLLAPQRKMLDFALKQAGNSPLLLEIKGKLNTTLLWQALNIVVERHETLRTAIDFVDGQPVQIVSNKITLEPKGRKVASQDLKHAYQEFVRPFNLSQPPLLRAEIWEVEPTRHILALDIHHIISDGSSIGILMKELLAAYEGKELPTLEIQYRDYALWQNELLKSGGLKKMEDYWLKNLAGVRSSVELSADLPRPVIPNYEGKDLNYDLSPETTRQVYNLALETKTTTHVIIMAVYAILLAKYSGKRDIAFEEGIAGRSYPEIENLIGMFVNVIPIRSLPQGQKSFRQFLEEMNQILIKAYECQEYPVAKLAQKLNLKIDEDLGSLQFDTAFVYQSMEIPEIKTADWEMKINPLLDAKGIARRELLLVVNEVQDRIVLKFVYRANLFQPATIEKMAQDFNSILTTVLNNSQQKLEVLL